MPERGSGAAEPPTAALVRGKVGEPLYVLTRPDFRTAEEIEQPISFETIDGIVNARPGDIVITTHGGERYPILKRTFFGAYRVFGRIGPYIGAERLIHVRRAWPILSADAVFDYGSDRGQVPAAQGGWLYQSDDADFGLISRDVNEASHTVIGPAAALDAQASRPKFERWSMVLSWLPPVLTLVALLAFNYRDQAKWPTILTAVDSALLLVGAGIMWRMRAGRWLLKSCVWSGMCLCRRFQTAVELLGESPSQDFPGMALWRAAQRDIAPQTAMLKRTVVERLKEEIGVTLHEATHGIQRFRVHQRVNAVGTVVTFALIFVINVYLLTPRVRTPEAHHWLEFAVIWLPSLIAAWHSFNVRRHTTERIVAMTEFVRALMFVRTRLFAEGTSGDIQEASSLQIANLQLICRIVAQHSQRELAFALSGGPELPM